MKNSENLENSNSKFKLSGWDKFKILLSILFVIYGWWYFLNIKTPQNLDELETCVGKIELNLNFPRHSIVYEVALSSNNKLKQTKFIPASVNSFYGYIDNWLDDGKAKYLKNANLLRDKTAKIWYQTERSFLFWHKVNRAYQIQILDFDYEKNPSLKNGEYFTIFTKPNIWFMDYMILFMVHIFFLIITIKILIKSKEK